MCDFNCKNCPADPAKRGKVTAAPQAIENALTLVRVTKVRLQGGNLQIVTPVKAGDKKD